MVDIQNHEESLKELSKTSLINNLTLILCWSAQEAGRYLELYKSYEHASPTSIRAHQATSYSEKLVEFITVPRSINKTDALSLVSAFGSIRAAVNARPEEIGEITGWGEKKVQRWVGTVRENFRVRKAARRGAGVAREESAVGLPRGQIPAGLAREDSLFEDAGSEARQGSTPVPTDRTSMNEATAARPGTVEQTRQRPAKRAADEVPLWEPSEDEEGALLLAAAEEEGMMPSTTGSDKEIKQQLKAPANAKAGLSEGMAAALANLRKE